MKKNNLFKRTLSAITASLMLLTVSSGISAADVPEGESGKPLYDESVTGAEINFAKALQLSMYFYDANKCGTGITNGNLEWRGDCHVEDAAIPLKPMGEDFKGTNLSQEFIDKNRDILDPDGDGTIDLSGGMHDAGDHVKFCLPGSYAASTLGWGYYEFRDAYKDSGQQWHIEDILHHFNDYYLKCTYFDENGDILAFCYQVGEGNIDHNYWNAPELQNENLLDFARPAYFATTETPASDMCAGVAASLAVNYLNFKDTEPEYAKKSLDTAIKLYEFAVKTHTEEDDCVVTSLGYDGGFYTSSYDYDELAWAAVWLYECTENYDYIDDIIHVDETVTGDMGAHPYTGYLKRIIKDTGNCWQNIWVHCWDTVWGGVFAKLAPITNCSRDWYIFRWNLEFWSGMTPADAAAAKGLPAAVTAHKDFGLDDEVWKTSITAEEIADLPEEDGAWLKKTPAGFAMLNDYGSARYDTAAQLEALVYAKETGDFTFADWSKGQMEYIMGNNPMGRSYIVGYDLENGASHPHHRAAHGSKTLNMDEPADQTHVLWGALVGGPDANDYHRDITKDYIYNEVAVDYNTGFVGACAGLYKYYGKANGDKPLKNFPPSEKSMKGDINEYYLEARVVQENTARSQIEVKVYNDTSLPPRYEDNIKCRYFFNINELTAAGQTIDDVIVDIFYDEENANTNGESFATISEPVKWDNNGTYYVEISWQGCEFYGKRVFHFGLIADMDSNYQTNWGPTNDYSRQGIEISEDELKLTEYITVYADDELVWGIEPEGGELSTLKGDVNLDNVFNVSDAVKLSRYILNKTTLKPQGIRNGDFTEDNSLNTIDLVLLKRALTK
ncbi:MAG: glycoside hydrolase family 9 protein [Clostridium sp.]|nr:glycoside hydrolase family 9 protein [Clostridium sp.]MCM1547804.1 glycoside hydrolase family 9 protein [Ruminococcus sp.]